MGDNEDWMTDIDPRLAQQLDFLQQINALKKVYRANIIGTNDRQENSAEHSWHLAMYAMVLAEHASAPVDINRVIAMLLIHDIVEVDAGDLPLHGPADPLRDQKEIAAAERLFNLLPADQAKTYRALWDEFETGTSDDARFAKALDRFQPVVLNHQTDGGTWSVFDVNKSRLETRTNPIEKGSATLWSVAKALFTSAVNKGWVKPG